MFNELWGVSAERSLTVDTLHALYLGVMNVFCKVAVWYLLMSGVYGSTGSSPGGVTCCCLAMRSSLFAWFTKRHAEFPTEVLTHLCDLTPAMVGTSGDRKCKTKASETWSMLLFLLDEIQKFNGRLGDEWQRLLQAGQCLESMVLLWRRCSWKVPPDVIQESRNPQTKHSHTNLQAHIHIHTCTHIFAPTRTHVLTYLPT